MDMFSQTSFRNRLLRSLSTADLGLLSPHLEHLLLPMSSIIEEPGLCVDKAIFFESGIGSTIVLGADNRQSEGGHIGREGMSGRAVVLGSGVASTRILMQVPGEGFSVRADLLREAMEASRTLRGLMNLFISASEVQVAHTLLAATGYHIEQRLARWLLMYHDRIDGDDLPVTHGLLGMMLNVRRAGVTNGIHILEGEHAIRADRGRVHVRDRAKLVAMAGGSYGIPEAEYERLIPAIVMV